MRKLTTILGVILFTSFILVSCGGSNSKDTEKETTEETTETTEETTEESTVTTEEKSSESGSDCEQFMKDYEEFVNSYIKITKKMKANPSDMTIMTEYSEMATKAGEMQTNTSNCTDAKYATKLLELNNKIAKLATEL